MTQVLRPTVSVPALPVTLPALAAFRSGQRVHVDYINHRGEGTSRVIIPLRWFFGATGFYPQEQILLDAWDCDKIAHRTFAAAGLRSWSPVAGTFPRLVCLCGSTRFQDDYLMAQKEETLAGRIYLSVGMYGHQVGLDMQGPVKVTLDELHFRKIELADEVLVIDSPHVRCTVCQTWGMAYAGVPIPPGSLVPCTCTGGYYNYQVEPYIGASTRREIDYATLLGKPVRYRSKEKAQAQSNQK